MQKILIAVVAVVCGFAAGFVVRTMMTPLADSQQKNVPVHIHPHDSDVHESDHAHTVEPLAPVAEIDQRESSSTRTDSVVTPQLVESPMVSDYADAYTLSDLEYGTEVTVTLTDASRVMTTNALPNHETGAFPSEGNPNTISAQSNTYEFPLEPEYVGTPTFAREPGVALNGVKFESQTAERVTCATGELYSIEAIQDVLNLGLDFNNAHVQPTGAYHYHGVSDNLIESFDEGPDLVLVGFAKDGHFMYYSKSGAYAPSYRASTELRTGTDCVYNSPSLQIDTDLEGTVPDGTYVSDWEYVADLGELDECNGTIINGEYAYLITDSYPYIPRCLMGTFTESTPSGQQRQ